MDDYKQRFKLTKTDYKYLQNQGLEESQLLQEILAETYNAHGELVVRKYLDVTSELDITMLEGINPGNIETAVYQDPYWISMFIPELPIHLKEYNKTMFSKKLGHETKKRWQNYMIVALRELRAKGAVMFDDKVVISYVFHFPNANMDVDNYAIKCINDMIRYGKIIEDDSIKYVEIHWQGLVNKDKKGTEINIMREVDFNNFRAALYSRNTKKICR